MKSGNRKKSVFNLSEELGKAIHLHQNGQFQQAKIIYKKIIRYSPMHPEALHMLGILYTQAGRHDTAVDLMRKSIKYAPGRPDYLFNLARAYHDLGSLDDSIVTYQEFLRLVPDDSEALHWLGRVWHDKKAFEQAIIYYQRALEKCPERVDYLNSLGLTYHAQGDFEQAILCYKLALKSQSNDFIVLNNLGMALRKEGKLEEAAENFKKAVAAEPNYAEAHYNLGLVCGEQKKFAEAASCFRRALSANPEYAEAHYNLGLVLRAQKIFEGAASCFRHVLSVNPEYAEAHYNLGLVLLEMQMPAEATDSFQQALSCKPEYSEAYCSLGHALSEQKKFDEAIDSLQMALSRRPEYPDAYVCLGRIYLTQGDYNNALASCKKALAFEPDHVSGLLLMANIPSGSEGNSIVLRQEKVFSKKDLEDGQKIQLAAAFGKAHADNDDYDKAFYYFSEGNRLKRESYEYSIEEDYQLFNLIKKVYSERYIFEHADEGSANETPIFILGMPRSGTSLVEQILASHPDVWGAGELDDFHQVILKLTGGKHSLTEVFKKIPLSAGNLYKLLAAEYLHRLRFHSTSARYITDKYPHNFLYIGAILLALPNAKIIRCVRDPMDNCFSIYKNFFSGEHKYAHDQQELGQYYLLYVDLIRHWHDVFPGKIYDIKYENLIADQEGETRKLLQHCGLSWNDQCLSFYKTSRNVLTLSSTQVRKPIYKNSVKLWEKYRKYLKPLRSIVSGER